MIEGKEMAPFIAANGQRPGWKRGSPPSNIRVPARRIRQRVDVADGGGNSSDDEAGPVHNKNRRQVPATKTRDVISTRDDDLPTPVPEIGLANDAVADGSDSDSGPDSPTSPTSPINSPVASAPPPAAAQPPVTLTPIKPPGPRPSLPPPVNPSSNLITGTALPVEDNDSASGRGRMDPNTEHALIAVGSIGSFIFASFIIWIVWRTVRRTRKKRRERESQFPNLGQGPPPPIQKPGIGIRFAAKVPFLRNIAAARGWHNLDDGAGQPPPYEKGGRGSLRLDTDVYAGQPKFQQPSSATYSLPQTSANGTPITVSPTSMALQRNDTLRAQQGTYQSGNGTIDSIMARYGNGGDMSSTLQSVGGGLYYVESEMEIARQQTNAYGRPANRASAISSLSSGFGDGDIIVPGLQPPPPASQALRSTQNVVGRYSWVSKSESSNRETIYTETSEDLPPRFRTVNSWVNQQTGRVKRAQGRSDDEEDVPPVPGLPAALGKNIMPPEQQFNMMMPDGEEPRRPDDYQLR
ncbi:hypothetical protein ACHAP0_005593 [Verticillium nonalfalfae]